MGALLDLAGLAHALLFYGKDWRLPTPRGSLFTDWLATQTEPSLPPRSFACAGDEGAIGEFLAHHNWPVPVNFDDGLGVATVHRTELEWLSDQTAVVAARFKEGAPPMGRVAAMRLTPADETLAYAVEGYAYPLVEITISASRTLLLMQMPIDPNHLLDVMGLMGELLKVLAAKKEVRGDISEVHVPTMSLSANTRLDWLVGAVAENNGLVVREALQSCQVTLGKASRCNRFAAATATASDRHVLIIDTSYMGCVMHHGSPAVLFYSQQKNWRSL